MHDAKLVFPDYCHQQAMETFVKELRNHDHEGLNGVGFYESYENDFVSWIQKEKQMHLGIHMDEGLVPGTTFLYMLDDEIVGSINIRHCLNDYLKNIGGHIGYSIAPKYRRQGFATKMLQEALKFCKQWEIWPVLVTCDEDNMDSKKTIEKCGGIFENKYSHEGNVTLRYWIGGEEK